MHGKSRQTGDIEAIAPLGALLLELIERMLQLRDGFLCLRQEFDAATRERHLAGRARDQLDAHLLLELAHAMTDRRLRQVEMRGRFAKAAALRDAEKGLQAEKVYSHADARLGLV